MVTVSIPEKRVNWKRLIPWIVLACVVAGLSVGGYYLYDQVTSVAELPKPPVQPEVVAPATPSETAIQAPVPLEEGLYHDKDGNFIGVINLEKIQNPKVRELVEKERSEIVIEDRFLVYKIIGQENGGGFVPIRSRSEFEGLKPILVPELHIDWETNGPEDAGVMAVTIDDSEGKVIYTVGTGSGRHVVHVWTSKNSGLSWDYLGLITNPELSFREKEQIYNDLEGTGGLSLFASKRDPANENIIIRSVDYASLPLGLWTFLLSVDGGTSWFRLNLPPGWESEGNVILTDKHHFDLISSDGTLKLFLAANTVWQAEISLSQ